MFLEPTVAKLPPPWQHCPSLPAREKLAGYDCVSSRNATSLVERRVLAEDRFETIRRSELAMGLPSSWHQCLTKRVKQRRREITSLESHEQAIIQRKAALARHKRGRTDAFRPATERSSIRAASSHSTLADSARGPNHKPTARNEEKEEDTYDA